jgi:hypothetical protein
MAKPKKKSKKSDSLAVKGSFADVIKVSVATDQGAKKPDKKAAKKKK